MNETGDPESERFDIITTDRVNIGKMIGIAGFVFASCLLLIGLMVLMFFLGKACRKKVAAQRGQNSSDDVGSQDTTPDNFYLDNFDSGFRGMSDQSQTAIDDMREYAVIDDRDVPQLQCLKNWDGSRVGNKFRQMDLWYAWNDVTKEPLNYNQHFQ